MIGSLVRQDLRLLIREKTLYLVMALALGAVCYAVYSGSQWKEGAQVELDSAAQALADSVVTERANLRGIQSGEIEIAAAAAAGLPHVVATEFIQFPGPLAELSVGDSDLRPAKATIKAMGRASDTFRFYQVDNPAILALGRFDLAFVVVYLLPLLILGMTYSVLSADRESGSLQLLLSQPVTAASVTWARIALRTTIITGVVVFGSSLAWLVWGPDLVTDGGLQRLGIWYVATVIYSGFWACLAGLVAARNRNSDTNALILLLIWALLTLLVPSAITVVAQTLSPAPSRLEYVTTTRAAENDANARSGELLQGYLLDHPEMEAAEQSAVAPFIKTFVLVQESVDAAVAPVVARFEERLDEQQRLTTMLSFLSPASLTQTALSELAGTSLSRHRRFESEALSLRSTWLAQLQGPLIEGRRITTQEFDRLPRLQFVETQIAQIFRSTAIPLAALLIYTVILFLLARRRLRQFAPAAV